MMKQEEALNEKPDKGIKKDEKKTEQSDEPKLEEVSSKTEADFDFKINLEDMLEAGVYFGHKTTKIHPKMRPHIYGVRNTINIIDLQKSAEKLEEALKYLKENFSGKKEKTILFVGTSPATREIVRQTAKNLGMPYVSERWLGGTLTNFKALSKRLEYFRELERKQKEGELSKYSKKEQHKFNLEIQKLEHKMGGMKEITRLPDMVFIVDLKHDYLAAKEARRVGIPTMSFCDTNVDPTSVDWPIPANDDAISSIKYILGKAAEALKV